MGVTLTYSCDECEDPMESHHYLRLSEYGPQKEGVGVVILNDDGEHIEQYMAVGDRFFCSLGCLNKWLALAV